MSGSKEKQKYKLRQQFQKKNQEKINTQIANRFMETLETMYASEESGLTPQQEIEWWDAQFLDIGTMDVIDEVKKVLRETVFKKLKELKKPKPPVLKNSTTIADYKKRKAKLAKDYNKLVRECKKEKDIPIKKQKMIAAKEMKKKHKALGEELKVKERELKMKEMMDMSSGSDDDDDDDEYNKEIQWMKSRNDDEVDMSDPPEDKKVKKGCCGSFCGGRKIKLRKSRKTRRKKTRKTRKKTRKTRKTKKRRKRIQDENRLFGLVEFLTDPVMRSKYNWLPKLTDKHYNKNVDADKIIGTMKKHRLNAIGRYCPNNICKAGELTKDILYDRYKAEKKDSLYGDFIKRENNTFFFLPQPFPYRAPEGVYHYILWAWGPTGKYYETDKKEVEEEIKNALYKLTEGKPVEFVWFENSFKSISTTQHYQVFWHYKKKRKTRKKTSKTRKTKKKTRKSRRKSKRKRRV